MNTWKEYIESYFDNSALFKVTFNESKNLITIDSSKIKTKTRIDFIFTGLSYERLVEIQFCNGFDYSKSYCIQYLGDESFSADIKNVVDNILIVPVYKGWIEEDFYFIIKQPYKTKYYFTDYGKIDYVAHNSLIGLLSIFGLLSTSKINIYSTHYYEINKSTATNSRYKLLLAVSLRWLSHLA